MNHLKVASSLCDSNIAICKAKRFSRSACSVADLFSDIFSYQSRLQFDTRALTINHRESRLVEPRDSSEFEYPYCENGERQQATCERKYVMTLIFVVGIDTCNKSINSSCRFGEAKLLWRLSAHRSYHIQLHLQAELKLMWGSRDGPS